MSPVSPTSPLDPALAALIAGRHRDPFSVLGPHLADPADGKSGGVVIRSFNPAARTIDVLIVGTGERLPMIRREYDGVFEALVAGSAIPDYRLRITFRGDHVIEVDDPYRYGQVLTDFDLHLFAEGTHQRAFEKLGAHRIRVGSTIGVHFAVWAPN